MSTLVPTKLQVAWVRVTDTFTRWIGHDLIAVSARVSMAAVFFLSGRTKVEGVLDVTDATLFLFAQEYRLPLIPAPVAAHVATYAEHFFPILLFLGLGTRASALALLAMTLVIQIFVYPGAWPTHLSWATLLLYLVGRGAGRFSLDHPFGIR